MRFVFHGAAQEVGRSCIEMSVGDGPDERRFLLDAGFKVHGDNPLLPTTVADIGAIDGVFITHAHMDHIGALPYLHHSGLSSPIFMTGMTKRLSEIMLEDSFHLELLRHHHPAYTNMDVRQILKRTQEIKYFHLLKFHDLEFEYMPSGHIPGASMILFNADGKTILYSGDIFDKDTHLLHGFQTDFLKRHDVDVLILESTYGNKDHKNRRTEEKRFAAAVQKYLKKGGSVLIPSFAIGRAQELLMMLGEMDLEVPLYLDGMAKRVAQVLVKKDLHIRNADRLRRALSKTRIVRHAKDRKKILHNPAVIVTTSGMVSGGPVMEYIKHFWHDEKSSILLTGFQGAGTNGRMLLESQQAYVDGMLLDFRCGIERFDFSGHIGRSGLVRFAKKVAPKQIILNHGDREAIESLREELSKITEVHVPSLGSSIML
ncbi:MAG: MBL fold metallo-hydrolase [Nanoarchaeota archaeon]